MLFILILFILFLIFYSYHSNSRRADAIKIKQSEIERLRTCHACAERIRVEAKKCKYCSEELHLVTDLEMDEIEEDYAARIKLINPYFKSDKDKALKAEKIALRWQKVKNTTSRLLTYARKQFKVKFLD